MEYKMENEEQLLKAALIKADPSVEERWDETMQYDTTKAILEAMKMSTKLYQQDAWDAAREQYCVLITPSYKHNSLEDYLNKKAND